MNEPDREHVITPVPGARSKAFGQRLRSHESRNVTFLADDYPIVWESASGAVVLDVDGNRYIDATAAFGVVSAGHGNVHVAHAVARQARTMSHGMGDVHPTAIRIELFERLAQILPASLERAFLTTTGSEAVEVALKTAMLATGKSRFAAYRNGYHGLSFGALAVAGIERFRAPFAGALATEPLLLDYPLENATSAERALSVARETLSRAGDVAALIVEPIQGRAGAVVPPDGYLGAIVEMCAQLGIVSIVDEIFTGYGRTGTWFAIERDGVVPDILCIGKAMGSGVPISAAVGRRSIMDAWPRSTGEALHTSTYLGNPLGCAAALATIDEFERLELPRRARQLGTIVAARRNALLAHDGVLDLRGRGAFWGLVAADAARAGAIVRHALRAGVILLQSGSAGNVVSLSPPLIVTDDQLERVLDVLEVAVAATA